MWLVRACAEPVARAFRRCTCPQGCVHFCLIGVVDIDPVSAISGAKVINELRL